MAGVSVTLLISKNTLWVLGFIEIFSSVVLLISALVLFILFCVPGLCVPGFCVPGFCVPGFCVPGFHLLLFFEFPPGEAEVAA